MYLIVYVALLIAYIKTLFYMARKSVEIEEFSLSELSPRTVEQGATA
jgi:cytochrome d ubiquinol oxidase subunit I